MAKVAVRTRLVTSVTRCCGETVEQIADAPNRRGAAHLGQRQALRYGAVLRVLFVLPKAQSPPILNTASPATVLACCATAPPALPSNLAIQMPKVRTATHAGSWYSNQGDPVRDQATLLQPIMVGESGGLPPLPPVGHRHRCRRVPPVPLCLQAACCSSSSSGGWKRQRRWRGSMPGPS
jgi:hypothetical protein